MWRTDPTLSKSKIIPSNHRKHPKVWATMFGCACSIDIFCRDHRYLHFKHINLSKHPELLLVEAIWPPEPAKTAKNIFTRTIWPSSMLFSWGRLWQSILPNGGLWLADVGQNIIINSLLILHMDVINSTGDGPSLLRFGRPTNLNLKFSAQAVILWRSRITHCKGMCYIYLNKNYVYTWSVAWTCGLWLVDFCVPRYFCS